MIMIIEMQKDHKRKGRTCHVHDMRKRVTDCRKDFRWEISHYIIGAGYPHGFLYV